jgi:two-component system sensor histidine kinase KdpD
MALCAPTRRHNDGERCCLAEAAIDVKTELAAGLVAESIARSTAHSRTSYWSVARLKPRAFRGCLAGLTAVALVTFAAFRLHLNLSATGSLYFLIVVMVSVVWGFWEASVTSLVAVNCLNYFFVPPVLTWRVSDAQDWFALAAFEITALVVSRLSARAQAQARAEARQRWQVEKLYDLSRRVLFLDRRRAVGPQIVSLVHEIFGTESVALFDASEARLDATGSRARELEDLVRSAYFQDGAVEGGAGASALVLRLGSRPAGAIAFCGPEPDGLTGVAVASLAAIALERARSFERESRAEAARQTEELRTSVLDSLAHAFKTPLTAILTASSGILEAGRLSPDDVEMAALIDEQAAHLTRLTTELLQMARIDAAEVVLHRERFSALTLIEDVLAQYSGQLDGHRVIVSVDAARLEVFGDREILATALGQFVDNASRYSTPGTPISVTAGEELGEIVFAVHNEGPPILPADRERIFERFYRARESRHRAPGTGLGLSIAKKTAEAHGGRTWVVSEEGAGTTFFFALPSGARRQIEPVAR